MAEAHLDVVTIGNAIVDILSHADGDFLIKHDLPKGSMNLVDAERSARLYDAMGPGVEMSGGSAANTAVGVASLGGSGAFIGKVHADALGEVFAHDIRAAGIDFETPQSLDGPPTARCLVFVAPWPRILAPVSSLGRTTSHRMSSPAPRSLTSRGICGIRRGPRRHFAGRSKWPTRPAARRR